MIRFETKIVREAKLLLVEWEDSVQSSGWEHFSSNSKESMKITSVGYSTELTEEFLFIVPHLHLGGDGMPVGMLGQIQIPRRAITSIRELVLKEQANASA